jgi:hypothetical protein
MTATTTDRDPYFAGQYPSKGTFPAAASTAYLAGTFAAVDANGRASNPATGLNVLGCFALNVDNSAGANDAKDCEVRYGLFGFLATGTAPKVGQLCYVADNQTVTLTPGTIGIAGIVQEVRTINGVAMYFFYLAPHVSGLAFAGLDANDLT